VVRRFCERDDRTSLDSQMAILHPDIEWVPVQSDPEYSVHRGHDDVRASSPKSADVWLSGAGRARARQKPRPDARVGCPRTSSRGEPKPMHGAKDRHIDLIRISYRSPTDPELGRSSCFGREAALPMERGRRSRPLTSLALVRSSGQLPRAELGRRNRVLDPNLAQSLRTFIIS
jgi:hypothetical protein